MYLHVLPSLRAVRLGCLTVDTVLLKALPWSKVDVASDLADLYEPPDVASLVNLLLEFVCPSLLHTLLDGGGVVECPALDTICLTNILTCIAAWVLHSLRPIAAEMQ